MIFKVVREEMCVSDEVVCERLCVCVTKLCVKDCVCGKVVFERKDCV